MIVSYKFDIGQDVFLKELERPGVVIALYTGRRGSEYQVRYCFNGKYEEVYLFEHELENCK